MIKNTKKGFTLIELLVVIAIIGILSSVVVASMNSARQKARDTTRVDSIKSIKTALELYYDANNQEYPDALTELVTGGHLPAMPTDPVTSANYFYDNLDELGDACDLATGACNKYHLGGNFENSAYVALSSDGDICAAAAAGCSLVYAGTTINGNDSAGCGSEVGVYCYDIAP